MKGKTANASARHARLLASAALGLAALPSCAAAQEAPAATPAPSADLPADQPAGAERAEEQAIIVTGSRLANSSFNAPTPVTTLGTERLQKMGSTNIGEALATLPSFRASSSPSNSTVGSNISPVNAGARIADLRGLGQSRTLVLVDSRRFAPSTSTGTVDLNLIPTLLIERADIVTGGASAAYGSDAVSGVINIILNKHLEGVRSNFEYGVTDRGDGNNYVAQIAAGTSFADGRGHAVFGAEYDKDLGVGGCYTRTNCSNEVGNLTQTAGVNGRPANNIAYNVHTATLTPGGLITGVVNAAGTRSAARGGPLGGLQFDANGNPVPFSYGQNAGALFMEGGTGAGLNSFFGDPALSIPVTRYNAFGHFEYEASPAFTGFIDMSYGHVAGYTSGPEVRDGGFPGNGSLIRIDNPFLPNAIKQTMQANGITGLVIGKLGTDFGQMDSVSKRDTFRIVTGANGKLGGTWAWDGYVQYGVTDYTQSTVNDRITANYAKAIDAVADPVTGKPICRVALTDPNTACRPLDILGQGQFSPEAKAYAFGTTYQHTRFSQWAGAGNVHGTLFEGWAGPMTLATGVEARRDQLSITVDPISAANGFYVYNATPTRGHVNVIEGYVEAGLPLLKDSPLGRSLDLNGAIRRTHYNTANLTVSNSFNATTWKIGGTYAPIDGVLLRVTESQDIRAPNTAELFTTPVTGVGALSDTKTGSQVFATIYTGGNINLRPEKARTFTTGITLQPGGALRGLRLSADYYKISIRDAIATLGAQVIVNTCNTTGAADICGLVTRNSSGILQSVSVLYLNLNRQDLKGLDFEASYHTNLGADSSLDLRGLATHTIKLTNSAVLMPGTTTPVNRAGDNGLNGVPSWVVDGFASLTLRRLTLNLQGHFISGGKYDASLIGPEDPGYSVNLVNSININRVPSRFYTNIGASIDLIKNGPRTLQVYGNVTNLFDVMPPPLWNGNNNSVYYDVIGRRYRVGVRYNF
ncbi:MULTISPECIES: TonB-dependent receptor domain-containing protein [unclassified Novosphingobium]|uniref:TonB-dependent receptor domain-containing protein n=1 Tax=unclassified Novosphingobium TaxID=2644732 RepID=UPI001494BC4E|nr:MULTISPECIES: TonB-dependent receptor [unclassified Novosphingobium]MBB3357394.1 outer membrane receptor protein involved in Fe transport [Novosphingobium sp. BK256]MBB3373944.1 outer membrane receptor protein involved in Fe transport [Novosphingobium sp. BK280]MBB3378356.1 outer membrane receptor protein involved in Fe transport [Novosphingobium sp. BK258]MBB3419860.1 outer membrane receptor protein involved in Fe transport [Novosphingobium sp. BK267]MBB3447819.1 outer membrane receptor pr